MIVFDPDPTVKLLPDDPEHLCWKFWASFGTTFTEGRVDPSTTMVPYKVQRSVGQQIHTWQSHS